MTPSANGPQGAGVEAVAKAPVSLMSEVVDRVKEHSIQVGVSTAAQVMTGQMNLKEAILQGSINVAVNAIGGLAANELSKVYDCGRGPLGYWGHKFGHFALGGAMGAAMGYDNALKGFLSGGFAGMGSEMLVEGLPSSMPLHRNKTQWGKADLIQLVAGVTAFLAGGDVNIASMTASNAVENNYAFAAAVPAMEGLGLGALGAGAASAAGLAGATVVYFNGVAYLITESLDNPAAREVLMHDGDTDLYYGPSANKSSSRFTPHDSVPSVLSTPGFEHNPIILGTPFSERRASVFATPIHVAPTWQEGYSQWTGPIFQCTTPIADNMPNTSVLESKHHLLPGEGKVGTFRELHAQRKPGDNLTPHHIPSNAYMARQGVAKNDGISIMVEQPTPGVGGRHRETRSYGTVPDYTEKPREALARDVRDLRRIYQKDNLYTPKIRESLKNVIELNKEKFPQIFKKKE